MLDILGITGPIYITILFGYLATRQGLSALFLLRDDAGGVRAQGCGHLFADSPANPSVD